MNRISILKATKKILEMQGGGIVDRLPRENEQFKTDKDYQIYLAKCDALEAMRLDTLKKNAINAGYKEGDIEVKWVTEAEYEAAKAVDPNEISRIAEQEVAKVKAKLAELDLKSIRSIREWLVKQADAPEYLKTYDAQAVVERKKIA